MDTDEHEYEPAAWKIPNAKRPKCQRNRAEFPIPKFEIRDCLELWWFGVCRTALRPELPHAEVATVAKESTRLELRPFASFGSFARPSSRVRATDVKDRVKSAKLSAVYRHPLCGLGVLRVRRFRTIFVICQNELRRGTAPPLLVGCIRNHSYWRG